MAAFAGVSALLFAASEAVTIVWGASMSAMRLGLHCRASRPGR